MKILNMLQKSPEWLDEKVAKVSGTRFGQAISARKNMLIYDLLAEKLQGFIVVNDYIDEDMQYGIDNEPVALGLYSKQTGINVKTCGAILADFSKIHMASPDGYNDDDHKHVIIQEVKCTQSIAKHAQRFFEGIESAYIPQCINYFAVSDDVKEVHFISYCGYDDVRPIHIIKLTLDTVIDVKKGTTIKEMVKKGRENIAAIENKLNSKYESYKF